MPIVLSIVEKVNTSMISPHKSLSDEKHKTSPVQRGKFADKLVWPTLAFSYNMQSERSFEVSLERGSMDSDFNMAQVVGLVPRALSWAVTKIQVRS